MGSNLGLEDLSKVIKSDNDLELNDENEGKGAHSVTEEIFIHIFVALVSINKKKRRKNKDS